MPYDTTEYAECPRYGKTKGDFASTLQGVFCPSVQKKEA